ncbi:hypothetical protein JZ751_007721 [Albula glossodonta]|uniref:Uncharacterized protein n=1 Tax=Albula glossodonta TaxID=121402 RepID=A0A8T2PB31_9TELE|nr:hypothetical protein JZ751_007721 [Albula glossodonta]
MSQLLLLCYRKEFTRNTDLYWKYGLGIASLSQGMGSTVTSCFFVVKGEFVKMSEYEFEV